MCLFYVFSFVLSKLNVRMSLLKSFELNGDNKANIYIYIKFNKPLPPAFAAVAAAVAVDAAVDVLLLLLLLLLSDLKHPLIHKQTVQQRYSKQKQLPYKAPMQYNPSNMQVLLLLLLLLLLPLLLMGCCCDLQEVLPLPRSSSSSTKNSC